MDKRRTRAEPWTPSSEGCEVLCQDLLRPDKGSHSPSEDRVKYELWRMDDNGNRFVVGVFGIQAEALDEARAFEAKGHKQTYWVESQKFS